ncbi:MAG: hypothetical protein HYT78_10365 [Deltaproteobacteria bacterium]|nr:hypothetical protein [Deltaproteobacteria bacterium]
MSHYLLTIPSLRELRRGGHGKIAVGIQRPEFGLAAIDAGHSGDGKRSAMATTSV